jgi:phosphatidylserine decarboxylase
VVGYLAPGDRSRIHPAEAPTEQVKSLPGTRQSITDDGVKTAEQRVVEQRRVIGHHDDKAFPLSVTPGFRSYVAR